MSDKSFRHDNDGLIDAGMPRPMVSPGKMPASAKLFPGALMRKARDSNGVAAGADDAVAAAASSSSGSALPDDVRSKFEGSLGADLSGVRVHTGSESAQAASAVGAKAYTIGNDIHFAEGNYAPADPFGLHLLAHEVAHTQQQAGATPTRQHKLEVSSPGDAAEVEADRAADVIVSGGQVAISVDGAAGLHRNPFDFPPTQNNSGFDVGGPGGAQTSNPFGIPQPQGAWEAPNMGPLGPFAPNCDGNGVPYDIPTTDYRSMVTPAAPALGAAMPTATVADPGPIPDWMTVRPAQTVGTPPFVQTTPAGLYIVHGDLHSQMAKDAWFAYKNELIKDVSSQWDGDARPKMDTYTQQKKGDPELERMIDESKTKYNMAAITPGAGTVSEQGAAQQVLPGSKVSDIADKASSGGQALRDDAHASAAQPTNTTVATPVKKAVDLLNAKREHTRGLMGQLGGTKTELDGAKDELVAAQAVVALAESGKEDPTDPNVELAKKVAGQIHPKLGALVTKIAVYAEPLKKLVDAGKGIAKAVDGDYKGAIDAGMAVADIAKWSSLRKEAEELALMPKDNPLLKGVSAAAKHAAGAAKVAEGLAGQVEASLTEEKALYEEVAKQLEQPGAWKGKSAEDAKVAADAMRALPVVDRLMRVLKEILSALPKISSGGTRANQGFTLATKGMGAPGAADLLQVAGWIAGAPKVLQPDIDGWEVVRARLQSVAASLGVV